MISSEFDWFVSSLILVAATSREELIRSAWIASCCIFRNIFLERYPSNLRSQVPTLQIFWSKDVAFMIDDTFEALRPKMTRYTTLEEATKALDALLAENRPHKGMKKLMRF